MNLLVKGAGFREGYVKIAGPGDGILQMLEFGRIGVTRARPFEGDTGEREVVFDIISGIGCLETGDGKVYGSYQVAEYLSGYAGPPPKITL